MAEPPVQMNIIGHRKAQKYSRRELVGRVLWGLSLPLFRLSPRPLWAWRNVMLRCFGAQIGQHVRLFPSVRILIPWTLTIGDEATVGDGVTLYALGPMHIGARVTISQGAHLCGGTHNFRDSTFPLIRATVTVEDDAWIAADAFVGPNVTVKRAAVVGARAVVMRDVLAGNIVAGNPAKVVGKR